MNDLVDELESLADPERALHVMRFFKTGPGQYGEGDKFLGLTVPAVRASVKEHWKMLEFNDAELMLKSEWHEVRLAALLVMIHMFSDATIKERKQIYDLYLANTDRINNWDLVDASADKIVGAYLHDRDKKPLDRLAKSVDLWERRIAIVATFHYIKAREYEDALRIAETLLTDKHDLIHKAVGWMLREIGKRDEEVEVEFLNEHYKQMPRTSLRYAIERFDPATRQAYLKGTI